MNKRFLIWFVSAFVAFVLLVGGVVALIVGINNSKALVKYESVSMDRGVVNYLTAYHKIAFIRALKSSGVSYAEDTDIFWQTKNEDGQSYADMFSESLRDYLSSIAVAANLYMTYGEYTAEDKRSVEESCLEILNFRAGGDKERFNRIAEQYGFDYSDFLAAASLQYRAQRAGKVIWGEEGEKIAAAPEECEAYLAEYTHVYLMFFKTNDSMSAQELDKKREKIETLKAAVDAKNSNSDGQIDDKMFENYLKDSDSDKDMQDKGYYFNPSAEKTAEFASVFADVVEKSFKMSLGEYAYVECEVDGSIYTCFISKKECVSGAYSDKDNPFFSDFYADASARSYLNVLNELSDEVKFTASYSELDPVSVPLLKDLYIREFK